MVDQVYVDDGACYTSMVVRDGPDQSGNPSPAFKYGTQRRASDGNVSIYGWTDVEIPVGAVGIDLTDPDDKLNYGKLSAGGAFTSDEVFAAGDSGWVYKKETL